MKKANRSPKPSEEEIISALNGFRPQPSDRFYNRMHSAPWFRERSRTGWFVNINRPLIARRWQPAAVFILMVTLLAILIISTPSARVVAQNFLLYFVPAQSDRIAVQVSETLPIALGTSVPAGRFSLDIEEAKALSSFKLKQISPSNADLTLAGAYHDPGTEAVALRYDGQGYTLILSQRPVGKIKEYASIGATAPVEPILVNGIPGEYVEGGWRVDDEESNTSPTIAPDAVSTLGIYWDAQLSQRTIRWQEGDMVYEILALGGKIPSKSDLLTFAERLK